MAESVQNELYINMKPDLFKQAPGHYDDAYLNIKNSLTSLSNYNSALTSSGFKNRTTEYNITYTNLYNNVNIDSSAAVGYSTMCTEIIGIYDSYQNGDYNTGAAQTEIDQITAPEITKTTNAEVGETSEENDVWDNIAGWFVKVGSWIANFIADCVATFVDIVASLLQGLCKLVEFIIDAAVLLVGTVVGWVCSAINWIFGTEINVKAIQDWVKGFVATDWVGSAFNWFYQNTGFGRWVADNSWIHDTIVQDILVGAAQWVGVVALGAVITYFTGGTALAPYVALVGGIYGFGSGAEKAYANGASYYGGIGKGAVKAVFDAAMGYSLGGVTQALTANMTTLVAKDGTTFALRRVGTGMKTKWQWVAMKGSGGSTALAPISTSTALIPYNPAAVGPYLGMPLLNVIGKGAFGLGTVAAGAGLLGLMESGNGGTIVDFGGGGAPAGGTTKDTCDGCGNPISQCTCGENTEAKVCDKCGQNPCVCIQEETEEDTSGGTSYDPGYTGPSYDGGSGIVDGGGTGPSGSTTPEFTDPSAGSDSTTPETPSDDTETPEEQNPTTDEDVQTPTDDETPTEDEETPSDETDSPEDSEQTETPGTTEKREPNISFINVGPATVDVTPSSSSINTGMAPSGVVSGGVSGGVAAGTTTSAPSNGTVQFENPSSGSITVKDEPLYEFESMTPTVENPDLENITMEPLASVNGPAVENITSSLGNSMENIQVASLSDLSNVTTSAPDLDASNLGMGGVAFGTAAASMYGASQRSSSSDEKKEEFKRKTEEEKNKFEEI